MVSTVHSTCCTMIGVVLLFLVFLVYQMGRACRHLIHYQAPNKEIHVVGLVKVVPLTLFCTYALLHQ